MTSEARLLAALQKIAKGEGAYNRDPLTHASNTIEAMKAIAEAALNAPAAVCDVAPTERPKEACACYPTCKRPRMLIA